MIAIPLQRADPPSEMLRRRALIHSQQGFADAGHERLTLQPLHISSSFSTAGRPIHRQCDDGSFGLTKAAVLTQRSKQGLEPFR